MTMKYPFDFAEFIGNSINDPAVSAELLRLYDRCSAAFPTVIPVELYRLLSANQCIASVWSIADVRERRPGLNDDQAWEVLRHVDHYYDATLGINWYDLERVVDELFGSSGNDRNPEQADGR